MDDFVFTLTREEFLDIFFDELALPNLVKRQLAQVDEYKRVRAGYTQTGVPTNINLVRTMRGAAGRRAAAGAGAGVTAAASAAAAWEAFFASQAAARSARSEKIAAACAAAIAPPALRAAQERARRAAATLSNTRGCAPPTQVPPTQAANSVRPPTLRRAIYPAP
jgi:hypothetical protein